MSEFIAALIGAIVGGFATFWATWWQTKRVLSHERDMARAAATAQRRAVRHEVDQEAARELLPCLSELEKVLPDVARGAHLYLETGRRAIGKIEEMRDLQHSTVAVLSSSDAQTAWAQLRTLVSEFRAAWTHASDSPRGRLSEGWTEQKVGRAQADIEAWIGYVRAHLLAIIDDSTPPPPVEVLPALRREDMSVWQLPTSGRG